MTVFMRENCAAAEHEESCHEQDMLHSGKHWNLLWWWFDDTNEATHRIAAICQEIVIRQSEFVRGTGGEQNGPKRGTRGRNEADWRRPPGEGPRFP